LLLEGSSEVSGQQDRTNEILTRGIDEVLFGRGFDWNTRRLAYKGHQSIQFAGTPASFDQLLAHTGLKNVSNDHWRNEPIFISKCACQFRSTFTIAFATNDGNCATLGESFSYSAAEAA
jgi:hypothetical protein